MKQYFEFMLWKRKFGVLRNIKSLLGLSSILPRSKSRVSSATMDLANFTALKTTSLAHSWLKSTRKRWFHQQKHGLAKKTSNWTLQEDNDPKHRSKISTTWKCSKSITTLNWPSQSPDLNPIENVWAFMKHKLKKNPVDSVDSLVRRLRSIWSSISKEYAQNLVKSLPKRLETVIGSKGDWNSFFYYNWL